MNESKLRERYSRASSEGISIISSAPDFFVVKGTRGSHYNVYVDDGISCTCPDAQAGEFRGMPLCKHRILVLIHVYQMDWDEILYLARELFTSKKWTSVRKDPKVETVDPRETDDCVICLEPLAYKTRAQEKKTVFCKAQCGTRFHVECMDGWLKRQTKCPMCRCKWV